MTIVRRSSPRTKASTGISTVAPLASSTGTLAVESNAQSPVAVLLNCASAAGFTVPLAYARTAPFANAPARSNSGFGDTTGTTA
jgi:hypothetical protein